MSVSAFVYAPPPEAPEIIHADHEILVVNKPSGLLSVPGRGPDKADCLIERLRGPFPTVLLVHRLDLDTSGVIIFGLTPMRSAALPASSRNAASRRPISPASPGGWSRRPGASICR